MGRKCTICTHPLRSDIDAALRGTQSRRQTALRFSVSEDALRRHVLAGDVAPAETIAVPPPPSAFIEFCVDALALQLKPAQVIIARVAFGGEDPIDVSPDAPALFGGVQRFPTSCRRQTVLRLGRASGKTLLAVAYGIWRVWTADLEMVGPGDEAGVVVLAPLKNLSARAVQVAENLCKASPLVSDHVRAANTERVVLERPDGRRAIFMCVPKSGGGAAARGMSVIDAILDESEYLPPSESDLAIRDVDLIAAMMPRLIPSGRLFLVSTPWPIPSETSRLFKSDFGAPKTALVARATTSVMRAGDIAIEQMIAFERARDPENARREYDCEDVGIAGSFIPHMLIDLAIGATCQTRSQASAGWDLGFVSDCSACVIVERQGARVAVVACELETPGDAPLVPSHVVARFSTLCTAAQCFIVAADQHYILSAREIAAQQSVAVCAGPTSQFAREQSLLAVRDLLRNHALTITQAIADQLKGVVAAPRPGGGLTITLPRRVGAGHADLVSALAMAIWLDRRYGPLSTATVAPTGPAPAPEYHGGIGPTPTDQGFQKW